MRFGDRLNVIFDIGTTDFDVPTLSVQPIVENAIKHGIMKKVEGGMLIVKTYETDDNYVVEVSDDGVGFNIEDVNFNENEHLGLNNVKYRIKSCGGDMTINSEPWKGTNVVITFRKKRWIYESITR